MLHRRSENSTGRCNLATDRCAGYYVCAYGIMSLLSSKVAEQIEIAARQASRTGRADPTDQSAPVCSLVGVGPGTRRLDDMVCVWQPEYRLRSQTECARRRTREAELTRAWDPTIGNPFSAALFRSCRFDEQNVHGSQGPMCKVRAGGENKRSVSSVPTLA